jgi:hypothetical protein
MDNRRSYGLCANLLIAPKGNSLSLVLGGMAEDTSRWTRVLSKRAALLLWYHLTLQLFPEKAVRVTALVQTMPARTVELPTITQHIDVTRMMTGILEITGRVGDQVWISRITRTEAQRLWDALDVALQPKGYATPVTSAIEE